MFRKIQGINQVKEIFTDTVSLVNFNEVDYSLQLETRNYRNSQNVTKYFRIPYIDESTHIKWLASLKLSEPKNIAFMINVNGDYAGVTYFHSVDYRNKTGEWGIYIYKDEFQGKGIGTQALSQCLNYAKNVLGLKEIYLDVLKDNERAKALYIKLGFVEIESEESDFLRFKRML